MSVDKETFMSTVSKVESGCWVWGRAKTGLGYGQIWVDGKIQYAHRMSWILHCGEIPNGLCVLHKCDNPPCVNPDHLFLGTKRDNMHDMIAKNRCYRAIGDKSPMSKLTWKKVRVIREMYSSGKFSQRELGLKFSISNRNVSAITRFESWKENETQPA